MTLKQALKQLADIEVAIAAVEQKLARAQAEVAKCAEGQAPMSVRYLIPAWESDLPKMRAAAAEGRAWINATYPEATI